MLEAFVHRVRAFADVQNAEEGGMGSDDEATPNSTLLPPNYASMTDQELAVWYNDNVIYPDKVRLNYYRHYSFWKDIEMIFATVLGWKIKFAGEEF